MIRAKKVTPKNFAAFGRVVLAPRGRPTSQSKEYKFWSDIASYSIEGETEIGICTVFAQKKVEITGMERHLRTPELLVPINTPFAVPLLLDGESEREAQAFRVDPGEAVVIDRAVWHGACLPVGRKQSSYFVIFRKDTPHDDVERKPVNPFTIAT